MTIKRLLVLLIGIFLVAGVTIAQGPRKDLGKNVPLPSGGTDQEAPAKSDAQAMKEVRDPNLSVERPSYSITAPLGSDWFYVGSGENNGVFEITYFKKSDSNTHTLFAKVSEFHGSVSSGDNPQEFLDVIKKAFELDTDPRLIQVREKEIELDDKFGSYSVRRYTKAEYNIGHEFLLTETYSYTFIHPNFSNLSIGVVYSERGKPDEIDPNFKYIAQKFIDGLRLKK